MKATVGDMIVYADKDTAVKIAGVDVDMGAWRIEGKFYEDNILKHHGDPVTLAIFDMCGNSIALTVGRV